MAKQICRASPAVQPDGRESVEGLAVSASAKLIAQSVLSHLPRPPYLRLPKAGQRCAWSGLSRSHLNALILGANPPVKSFVVSSAGKRRGTRLIVLESLMKYLANLCREQDSV